MVSLVIPENVVTIGELAFGVCLNLKTVIISNSVKTIDNFAFTACMDLNSIVIGNGVNFIGNSAFASCNALSIVYYAGSESDWTKIDIDNTYDGNANLLNATRYYYSETEPTTEGNFWHWVDGEPVAW